MRTVFEKLKRNLYGLSAFAFLGVAMAPAFLATQSVAAAQLTERNITMSSSTPSASSQIYQVNFKAASTSAIQGVVVQFCAGSPIMTSNVCDLPTGMTVGSTIDATSGFAGGGTWAGNVASGNILRVTNASGGSVNTGTNLSVTVSGFTNPSTEGTFYARVVTYATTAGANAYTTGNLGTHVDNGGIALSTARAVNISATVQETLTFCVSGGAPADGCAGVTEPSLTLGTGTPVVLDTDNVYTGTVYYQLSTNAIGQTSVRIKSADAGLRSGSNMIDPLAGASATPVNMQAGKDSGTSAFGIRSDAPTGDEGTLVPQLPYNHASNYGNNPTNITSTYGDVISQATGALLNINTPLIFAATAGPTTPAGVYTGSFSLIASSSY